MLLGYCRKPIWIYLAAMGYLMIPILTLIGMMGDGNLWAQLKPLVTTRLFLQVFFCSVTAALAVLIVTRYSLMLLLVLSAYFIGFKVIQFFMSGWGTSLDFIVVSFWLAAPVLFLTTSLRLAYTKPETRWWKRSPRYPHLTRGTLYSKGVKFPVVMINFSVGGAFVKLDERLFDTQKGIDSKERREHRAAAHPSMTPEEMIIARKTVDRYPTAQEDRVRIVVKTMPSLGNPYPDHLFESEALVVWTTKVTDPLQHGLGLKFMNQTLMEKIKIRRYLGCFAKNPQEMITS